MDILIIRAFLIYIMRKLLKKSPLVKNKYSDFPAITHTFNDLWKDTCNGTVEKFNRVEIVHTPLSPPSKLFLENYDLIFRKDKKKEEVNV